MRLVGPGRIPPAVTKRSHWNGWVSDAEPYTSVLAEALFIQSYCSWSNLRSLSEYSCFYTSGIRLTAQDTAD